MRWLTLMFLAVAWSGLTGCSTIDEMFGGSSGSSDSPDGGSAVMAREVQPRAEVVEKGTTLDSVVRIVIPQGNGRAGQGAGVVVTGDRVLTATHVLIDDFGRVGDIASTELTSGRGQRFGQAFAAGWHINASIDRDWGSITSDRTLDSRLVRARVAGTAPRQDELVDAYLYSSQRGDNLIACSRGNYLGQSRDGKYFAVSGASIKGDSGGPVFNARGEVIGLVVSGGSGDFGVPFDCWKQAGGFHWQYFNPERIYRCDYIICTNLVGN